LRDVCHIRDAWTNYSRANDVPEHLAIVAPLLASDAEGAALAMGRHIESATITLEEVIFVDRNHPEDFPGAEESAGPPDDNPGGPD
jgi:DNA-binding GntR family transcriptional regulator